MKTALVVFAMASIFGISASAHAQNCSATDSRNMMDQLDCYCSPSNRSVVEERLDELGDFSKAFLIGPPSSCADAMIFAIIASKDSKAKDSAVQKLVSLGYSDSQIAALMPPIERKLAVRNYISSGCARSSSTTVTIGPFTFGGNKPRPECKGVEPLTVDEVMADETLAMLSVFSRGSSSIFLSQFRELDRAIELVKTYPATKISACIPFGTGTDALSKCLSMPDEKIQSCSTLQVSTYYKDECLSSKADSQHIAACGELHLSDYYTSQCLEISKNLDTVAACGKTRMNEYYKLECIKSNTEQKIVSTCSALGLDDYTTLQCIGIGASPEKIAACSQLQMSGFYTLECLKQNVSLEQIAQCANITQGDYAKHTCLNQ